MNAHFTAGCDPSRHPGKHFVSELLLAVRGPSCNADKVDAISVALAVRQIVAKVRAIRRDSLTRGFEHTHVLPDNLLILRAKEIVVRAFSRREHRENRASYGAARVGRL